MLFWGAGLVGMSFEHDELLFALSSSKKEKQAKITKFTTISLLIFLKFKLYFSSLNQVSWDAL